MRKLFQILTLVMTLVMLVNLSGISLVVAHPNHKFDDKVIFTMLDQVHAVEVLTSQVGIDKSKNQEILELSQYLNSLHKTHQEKIREILIQENVIEVEKSQASKIGRYAETVSNLRELNLQEFDFKFLEHELHFHMKVKHMLEKRILGASSNQKLTEHIQLLAGDINGATRKIKKVQDNYNKAQERQLMTCN